MVYVILTIVFFVGVVLLIASKRKHLGVFFILSAFVSITGYVYAREQAIKEYLNGELVVDTLCVSAEGKVLDLEVRYKE